MTCRMGEPIRTGVRVCMPRIGMGKVCMPIIGNRSAYKAGGDDVLKDLKSHMLGWYDVKRQGCTNESLAENPVLKDLSGKNHPLELRNFAFGGLSGMGGYGTDLTKWVGYNTAATPLDKHSVHVHGEYNFSFRLESTNAENFKVRCSVSGIWRIEQDKSIYENHIASGDIAEVYCTPYKTNVIFFRPDSKTTDYTLEILPNFPNSLVFNGVTPEYMYNRNNLKFVSPNNYGEWVSNNVVHIYAPRPTAQETSIMGYTTYGQKGEVLNVQVPSFIVRVTGINSNFIRQIVFGYHTRTTNNYVWYRYKATITNDGVYIISNFTMQLTPANQDTTPAYSLSVHAYGNTPIEDSQVVKIEFLPNYPSPTTKMYGIIPTITHGAKCMMMNFVPTFPMEYTDYVSYYTQRQENAGNQYALMTNKDGLITIAYNNFNSNGTYINGQLNNKLRHIDLLNKRQVVSVNANEVYEMPANRGVVIATDETLVSRFPTMALNSLILFDRELTEEEMKLVMDKLMKYEDTDNIATDSGRSAREMALDDSDMYEEYDVYEEGNGVQDIWEME